MASSDSEKDAKALLILLNELLATAKIGIPVKTLKDVNASLFVKFLEQLCDETLPDIVREPKTIKDDIHNLEIVLSMLSESLKLSFSHISPEDVVSGKLSAIGNLIEIFAGLVEGHTSGNNQNGKSSKESTEADLVRLANSLLEKAEMNFRVKEFGEIDSSFFVKLLDGLCQETIAGIVMSPKSTKEEERNVEVVIQILEDVTHCSLANFNPKDIVSHKAPAIQFLLELFSGFIEGILANESRAVEDDTELVSMANHVLAKLELTLRVRTPEDIKGSLFVLMWEQLCGERLPGVIIEPKNAKDEIHNVEVVIRALKDALDVLLSHVSPQDVVSGNRRALKNLLSVFSGIVEGKPMANGEESKDDEALLLKLANEVVASSKLEGLRIESRRDLNASFFIQLLEKICGELPAGLVRHPKSVRDEAYNLSIVIETLSDAMNVSLSHIDPHKIATGDRTMIRNLLQIFREVLSDESKLDRDDALVNLANDLLSKANLNTRVKKFRDIDALFFVLLLERLCFETLSGCVRRPQSAEDNLHNLQVVIETLSDTLKMSLSHINPVDICSGNRVATKHLLEAFYSLLEGYAERTRKVKEDELVTSANRLLLKADVRQRVTALSDMSASFFVMLFEELRSEPLPGIVRDRRSADSDVYNLKIVIDTLSNVVKTPLSHINPRDVIDCNVIAVKHLVEVFFSLLEASKKKTSKVSEDGLVKLMNNLLAKVDIGCRVRNVEDVKTSLLVDIVEKLCGGALSGIIRNPTRTEDEIRNIETLILTLEGLLKISLSHIPASAVVHGNRLAINNLTDILAQLAEGQETRLRLKRANDDAKVKLANEILRRISCDIKTVKTPEDMNASFFVALLERLCAERNPDVIPKPKSFEDEVHNVRVVLNTLSDLLKTPLSHIDPRDVIEGNHVALGHLLEVFYELSKDLGSFNIRNKTDDTGVVNLANAMLSKLHIERRVRSIRDVDASLFVTLFEGLCAETLPDVIRHPVRREDDIHNVDAVIDTLSMDVLSTSLSHITGRDVVSGDRLAISNLLEVFYGLMEFILEEIKDESRSHVGEDSDPDLVTAEVIDSVLQDRLKNPSPASHEKSPLQKGAEGKIENHRLTSRDVRHSSFESNASSQLHTDRTSDLIRLGESSQLESFQRKPQASNTTENADSGRRHVTNGPSTSSSLRMDRSMGIPATSEFPNPVLPPVSFTIELLPTSRLHKADYSRRETPSDGVASQRPDSAAVDESWKGKYKTSKGDRVIEDSLEKEQRSSYVAGAPSADSLSSRSEDVSFRHTVPAPSYRNKRPTKPTLDNADERHTLTDLNVEREGNQGRRPDTYQDYLMKYYGQSGRFSSDEPAYLSDGCIDYEYSSDEDSQPGSFERELESCRRRLEKRAKAVRFDDYLDDCATGSVGTLRRKFKNENKAALLRKELLSKVYHDELVDLAQETLGDTKKQTRGKEKDFRKKVFKPPQTARYRTKKYSAPVGVLLPRSRSGRREVGRSRKRSASADTATRYRAPAKFDDDSTLLLPQLLEEFPYLHLTPATLNNLWRKAAQRVEQLAQSEKDVQRRKTKAQEQIEDAERRQKALLDIMRKDLLHQQRLKEARDRQGHQLAVKAKIREKRLQSARIRKYYTEFHVRQRSKMLKKRTKEELMFKRLFHDGLDIQKDQIREVKKYAKEQREQRAKRQQEELESLENFYRDRFTLLAECLENERSNTAIRDKAQAKVLEKMKQEMRKKLEKEIQDFQQRLLQDEDDIYYRELDAERLRRELRLAQCHDKI